jgi:hypothetical protein
VQRGFRLTGSTALASRSPALDEGLYGDLQLSSDGKRVAVSLGAGAGNLRDIWIFERGLKTKFTSNPRTKMESSGLPTINASSSAVRVRRAAAI